VTKEITALLAMDDDRTFSEPKAFDSAKLQFPPSFSRRAVKVLEYMGSRLKHDMRFGLQHPIFDFDYRDDDRSQVFDTLKNLITIADVSYPMPLELPVTTATF
jgi:uncharacterized protein YecE (DUF72 family)